MGRASGGLEHGIQPDGQMPSDKTLSLVYEASALNKAGNAYIIWQEQD